MASGSGISNARMDEVFTFWGLRENPFSEELDTRFLYLGDSHRKNLNRLRFFVSDAFSHLDLLTGGVGLGKTLLLRRLEEDIDKEQMFVVYNPGAELSYRAMLCSALSALMGRPYYAGDPEDVTFQKFLRAYEAIGRRMIFMVDEAQALDAGMLRRLVGLTNLATRSCAPPSLIMGGNDALVTLVNSVPEVKGRVSMFGVLEPLGAGEIRGYVDHRMRVAEYAGGTLLAEGADVVLSEACAGIPRQLNQIMRRALVVAWGAGAKTVSLEVVRESASWGRIT